MRLKSARLQLVNLISYEILARARKESQIAPQASAIQISDFGLGISDLDSFTIRILQSAIRISGTAAKAKERYAPYDCKQDDFSSGPLESLNILPIPLL